MEKLRFKIETWQILFVGVASAFVVLFLHSLAFGLTPQGVADALIHTFFISSSVCLGVLYVEPKIYKFSFLRRILIMIVVIFIGTMLGLFLTRTFLGIFNNYGIENYNTPSRNTIIFSLVISYTFGFSAYFYGYSQNKLRRTKKLLRQKELDEANAKSLAVSAQLASLESRIQPHFLFNTLNSIAALIKENPDLAEKMVEKLSALLRYSLSFEPNKLVNLEQELKITKDYLEIESARFTDKLEFHFDIAKNLEQEKLPAFSLQTLVENSIKHVAAKRSSKTIIKISANKINENLIVDVQDNGDGFSEAEIKKGHGLDILRKRLENIFGNKAKLEILDGGRVNLQIRSC